MMLSSSLIRLIISSIPARSPPTASKSSSAARSDGSAPESSRVDSIGARSLGAAAARLTGSNTPNTPSTPSSMRLLRESSLLAACARLFLNDASFSRRLTVSPALGGRVHTPGPYVPRHASSSVASASSADWAAPIC